MKVDSLIAEAWAQAKVFLNWDAQGWTVRYDPELRDEGRCYPAERLISISERVTGMSLVVTLVHEGAHAIAEAGHGERWKRVMLSAIERTTGSLREQLQHELEEYQFSRESAVFPAADYLWDADPDVAVLRIPRDACARLPSIHPVLGLRDIADFRPPFFQRNEFLLAGYPVVLQEFTSTSADLRPFVLQGVAYDGDDPEAIQGITLTRPFLRGVDFLLHHDEECTGRNGRAERMPALQGMSGCSLWGMVPGTVPGGMRVFGVQTAVLQDRWVRCTHWAIVARVIYERWPELRQPLVDHFGNVFEEEPHSSSGT